MFLFTLVANDSGDDFMYKGEFEYKSLSFRVKEQLIKFTFSTLLWKHPCMLFKEMKDKKETFCMS